MPRETRIRGTFTEVFELKYFPFDVQALTVDLRLASLTDNMLGRYVAARVDKNGEPQTGLIRESVVLNEWYIYKSASQCTTDRSGGLRLYRCHVTIRRRHRYCKKP